ncbi:SDR family NAD(P)-dependent oxidoreductase [Stackebrandtia soli]|uniref:SDR family NAD(P)-dependent oxidoreductase n=1 Tax=Stackebrandtia soli TaxID=1892856 RepID=UPI0039EA6FC7
MSRLVLITGGGTGLGRAMAERFATGGDRVVITGRRVEILRRTATELGGGVTAIPCNHADPGEVAHLAATLDGTIDVIVNNAGGNTDIGASPAEDITSSLTDGLAAVAESWRRNLDANLISAVLTTSALLERVPDDGRLIHIGSIAADKGAGSYGAAKAALASWNIDLARAVGRRGITSNILSPGYTLDTEFFKDTMTAAGHAARVGATAVGRAGTPLDIAETAWFLASPQARTITAQTLKVDGGAYPSR